MKNERQNLKMLLLLRKRIKAKSYDNTIEWVIRHIVFVYTVEIISIVLLLTYGIISENGFMASGY